MTKFNAVTFSLPKVSSVDSICASIWQPVGAGRRSMHPSWRAKLANDKYIVVGRRGTNIKGCFSVRRSGNELDVAWHEFHTPSAVVKHITGREEDDSLAANAMYFFSNETSKYLEVDLLAFLTENAPEFLPEPIA